MVFSTSLERGIDILRGALTTLPLKPGIYRMIGAEDEILYIGKAKALRNRVTSYTRVEQLPNRHRRMLSELTRLEITITHTELDALLLENNLIKQHMPRYNILLKDDKLLTFVKITTHPYPQLTVHKGKFHSGDKNLFGPFASKNAVYSTLELLHKVFRLRGCSDSFFAGRKRPCLQYHIKRCSGPCVQKITPVDYQVTVEDVRRFLKGESHILNNEIKQRMIGASAQQDFEKAAFWRDQLQDLSKMQAHQDIHVASIEDADIIAATRLGNQVAIAVVYYRHYAHFGQANYHPQHAPEDTLEDVLEAFIGLFYTTHKPAKTILTSHKIKDEKLMEASLRIRANHAVKLHYPRAGNKIKLVKQAIANADEALLRKQSDQLSFKKDLVGIGSLFNLATPLERVEVYDNTHNQGSHAYGAMIVTGAEGFMKNDYRLYMFKTPGITRDDYSMMREMLTRRFQNAQDAEVKAALPDLILIDGGLGQLNAALSVMTTLNLAHIPVVAIAKGPQRNAGRETFYIPHREAFQLPHSDPTLHALQRLRDEAHRFGITAHRKKHRKSLTKSHLDEIPNLGAARKRILLQHFGSHQDVKNAALEDLIQVKGISHKLATAIYEFYHGA